MAPPLDASWEALGEEIDIPAEYAEEGLSAVFGSQGIEVTAPDMPAWTILPDDDLAHHVAHELTHILLRRRGFPKTGADAASPRNPPRPALARTREQAHQSMVSVRNTLGLKVDDRVLVIDGLSGITL